MYMCHFHCLRKTMLTALVMLLASAPACAQEIWVVTDALHPVRGAVTSARVVNLDDGKRIEAELSANLPDDQQHAANVVRERVSHGGPALQRRMQAAYQGVVDAWSLGITTIPAVLVDQRYVMYGEQDLDRALARIAKYREENP